MPRGTVTGRLLHPEAALSRRLAKCSIGAQLLFDRLISLADDQGRQHGDTAKIRASAFPLVPRIGPRDVEKWLGELEVDGLVLRYEAEGDLVLQLPAWWDWQTLEWARPSRLPAPPDGWLDRVGKRPNGELRTRPDPSGLVRQNEKENQNENQKRPVRRTPDSDPRSLKERVGPIPGLGAVAPAGEA